MKNLIEIYDEAKQENIKVLEHKIGDRKSIIAHTPNWTAIALNKRLIESEAEEKTVLFHEMGHHYTKAYYNFESKFELKCRKEYRAHRWAVMNYLPLDELLNAVNKGYTEPYQLAEYFDVTEEFIHTAYEIYKRQGKI